MAWPAPITRINAGILWIGTNFSRFLVEIHIFSFTKMHFNMLSGKWRPFCLSFNALMTYGCVISRIVSWYLFHRQRDQYWYEQCMMMSSNGQWRGAMMFSLICVWINGWVNNREAGDFRRCRAHYDVTVLGLIVVMSHNLKLLWQICMLYFCHALLILILCSCLCASVLRICLLRGF